MMQCSLFEDFQGASTEVPGLNAGMALQVAYTRLVEESWAADEQAETRRRAARLSRLAGVVDNARRVEADHFGLLYVAEGAARLVEDAVRVWAETASDVAIDDDTAETLDTDFAGITATIGVLSAVVQRVAAGEATAADLVKVDALVEMAKAAGR